MRRLGLFALVFIVLAALYWLLENPAGRRAQQEPGRLLSDFKPAELERITITSPAIGAVVLQRSVAGWQVYTPDRKTSYTADSAAVQALLDSLSALTTASMVARNPDRHALYEVTPETGLRVEVLTHEGRIAAAVVIGKNGPNIFSTYVRTADSDDVYLVDGILQTTASKTLNEWRDKTVFKLDPGLMRAYTVSGDRSLTLHKNDDVWQANQGETVTAEAAAQLMRTFAGLNAADFAEGSLEEFGLARPSRTITADLSDGTSVTLLLGRDVNAFQQYAKKTDGDTIYVIEKHLLEALCPTTEELNTPQPAPDAIMEAVPAEARPFVQ